MAVKEKQGEKKSRILEYLKETHKWENYAFLIAAVIVLVLGCLILTDTLVVKDNAWLIGDYPDVFAWILVGVSGAFTLYGLVPFFQPAVPEFKKVAWLPFKKFVANSLRVILFLVIFASLFLLYDSFITQILSRIFK